MISFIFSRVRPHSSIATSRATCPCALMRAMKGISLNGLALSSNSSTNASSLSLVSIVIFSRSIS